MGKIVVFNLVTIDGFFAGPNGEIDWHNYDDEMGRHSITQLKSLSVLIFGRTTYEMMASYWPTPEGIKGEPVVAEIMNNIPKMVFSKTLKQVEDGTLWKNVKVFHEIKPEDILKIKEQEGGDIAIFGSGTIVQQFTNLGLIDEYRLVVNPIILGKGKPLFKDIDARLNLKLLETKVFKNGNVLLRYGRASN
ncbi:MAG: dihydrofolate reductase [Candidatus Micrarchaeota archaeon]|nr:dihydrofolate reductase [Candidatus Micrarchaeota archaeon]